MGTLHDAITFIQNDPEEYKRWLENPVTKIMLDAAEDRAAPKLLPPGAINGDTALHMGGYNAGMHFIVNLLRNMDSIVPAMQEEQSAEWNMANELTEQGWSSSEVTQMMEDLKSGKIRP